MRLLVSRPIYDTDTVVLAGGLSSTPPLAYEYRVEILEPNPEDEADPYTLKIVLPAAERVVAVLP